MKLRKAIRKIVALGTGTLMLGATLIGAAAANLQDYPSPLFIKDGVFNGVLVVGDSAASSDVIGSVDIALSLQNQAKTETSISVGDSTSKVVVEGDVHKIETSGNPLNIGEYLNNVEDTISEEELSSLAKGVIKNGKGTFKYNQYVDMPTKTSLQYGVFDDFSDDPGYYLVFEDGQEVYSYKVTFPTALESDIDENEWEDLENKKIVLLGKEYTIIDTENSTKTLELMGGSIQDTMEEYTTKTYSLKDMEYIVEVVAISTAPEVILKVNGEFTEKLGEGDTFTLSDGTELGIRTLLENEGSEVSGGDIVEFYLGANKVTLKDGENIEVSGDTMDATCTMTTSESKGVIHISNIDITWTAEEEYIVPLGKKLSSLLDADEQGNLFLDNIDFEVASVEYGTTDEIDIQSSASNKYKLTFETKDNTELSFVAFYENGTKVLLASDDDDILVTNSTQQIKEDEMVALSDDKYSYLIQVRDFDNDKVEFKNIGTGDIIEVTASGCDAAPAGGSFYLGTKQFTFNADCTNSWVEFTGATPFGGDQDNDQTAVFFTKGGAKLVLSNAADLTGTLDGSNAELLLYEEGKDNNDAIQDQPDYTDYVYVTFGISDNDLDVSGLGATATTGLTMESWDSKDDFKTGRTLYGTQIEQDTDGEDELNFLYPREEATVSIYVSSGVTSTYEVETDVVEGEVVTSTEYNPIVVGSAKLASEVTDITAQNMIVIGGPCANSVAAELLGNPENCMVGFEEGKAIIKLYENGDNVAMLVAGATAMDTRRAARVLSDLDDYTLEGTEVEVIGTSTTFSDTVVNVVVPE